MLARVARAGPPSLHVASADRIERVAVLDQADETGDVERAAEDVRVFELQHMSRSALIGRRLDGTGDAQSAAVHGLVVEHVVRGGGVLRQELQVRLAVPAGEMRLLRDGRSGDE